jgi:hypothetical protein
MTELATYRRTGWTVQYWPQIGSTNDAALAAGQQGAAEGLLVLADEQTAGAGGWRGGGSRRRGRVS